jgi:transposase
VDDRRVVSGIVHAIRNGLRWRDAPAVYGPHKTLYNRFVRWSRMGIFDRIFANLAAESGPPDHVMIDSTKQWFVGYWRQSGLSQSRPHRRVYEFTQRAPDRSCRRRTFVTQNSKVWDR